MNLAIKLEIQSTRRCTKRFARVSVICKKLSRCGDFSLSRKCPTDETLLDSMHVRRWTRKGVRVDQSTRARAAKEALVLTTKTEASLFLSFVTLVQRIVPPASYRAWMLEFELQKSRQRYDCKKNARPARMQSYRDVAINTKSPSMTPSECGSC